MRKSLYILGTLFALAFISCSDEGSEYSTPALEVKSSDVIFSYEGGTGNIVVEADGTVMATSNADWCKVTSINGGTITLQAEANTDLTGRAARVEITSGSRRVNVIASQIGEIFDLSVNNLLFGGLGDTQTVTIESVYDVSVSSTKDWLTFVLSADKRTVTVTAEANPYFAERTAELIFTSPNGVVKTITVIQELRVLLYNDYIGKWLMTFSSTSNGTEAEVTISQKVAGKTFTLTGLPYPMTLNFTSGRLEFFATQKVGTVTSGGTTYDVTIWMCNDATGINNGADMGMYSTSDYVDGKVVLTLHNNGVWATGTGFGFYYQAGTSIYQRANYRTSVKLTQILD